MCYELFTLPVELLERLRSTDSITVDCVKKLMLSFSSGKIRKVQIGKLCIVNSFFPSLKDSGLREHEGRYVFFAVERQKSSFFSKASYRMLIWPPTFDKVFAIPVQSVFFEIPEQKATETIFLEERGEEHLVCKEKYSGTEHECFFEKMRLYRNFAVEKTKITCIRDFVIHYFRWTKPDPWVREHFTVHDDHDPMFFLRNDPQEIPGWSVRLSYPSRPPLWGWEIDE